MAKIYLDFCSVAFDEYHEPWFLDGVYGDIPEFVIGQLYARECPNENLLEDNINDALERLAEAHRREVVELLQKEMNWTEIYVWMHCTAHNYYRLPRKDDEDEEEYEINSMADYEAMIEDVFELAVDPSDYREFQALQWVMEGMYPPG